MIVTAVMDRLAHRARSMRVFPSGEELEGDPLSIKNDLSVYEWPSDKISPVAVVIGYPGQIMYGQTYTNGSARSDKLTIPVWAAVGRTHDRAARDRVAEFVDGVGGRALRVVLMAKTAEELAEGTPEYLAPVFDTITVPTAEFDYYLSGNVPYLAVRFDCEITGKGGYE